MKRLLLLSVIALLPLVVWCADGDTFRANTVEGVAMTFKVTSETNKQCQVGIGSSNSPAVNGSTTGAITIPSEVNGYSVTSIGGGAFYECGSLTSVTIPNSVTSIGGSAFAQCVGLTSVTIPNTVTSIGDWAFSNCSGLTYITIPCTVTSIGGSAFADCSGLTSVTVESGNTVYDSRDNCNAIIHTESNALIMGCKNTVISNSVTSIGGCAFSGCSGLTSISIPSSVMTIGYNPFVGCIGLTSIKVESGNTCYDSRDNCNAIINKTTNELIAGCQNTVIPNSVTSIGYGAFDRCSSLMSITIPNSVTSIGDWAFGKCSGLKSITIPNSVTSIGKTAFSGCSALTSVTIPNSVTSIGEEAFCLCSGLTSVTIPNSVTSIGDGIFKLCSGLTSITIPNSVKIIGNYAFQGCSGLSAISIPNSVAGISYGAFSGCSSLTSVTIPNSVLNIGGYAFSGCSALTSITIPNSVTSIGNNAFYGCSGLTSITIPYSVWFIGEKCFRNCSSLTSVTIPNSVTSIGKEAFAFCYKLTEVFSFIKEPFAINSNVFDLLPTNATLYVPAGTKSKYEATDGWKWFTTIIEVGGDNNSNNIQFVDANVESICVQNWDTDGDWWLSEMEAAAVTDIGRVFEGKSMITSFNELQYFTGLTRIGVFAFFSCTSLTSITIPNSVTSIGENAFLACLALTSITIPNSVTSIGSGAFQECSSLTSITIPNSVTTIVQRAFVGCSGLTSIVVENGNTRYDSRNNCNAIINKTTNELIAGCKNTVIPNSVTSIGFFAFGGCSGLTAIAIPNSVTSISNGAFSGCSGLTSITIPNSVTSIGNKAFSGCGGLTEVYSLIEKPFAIDGNVFTGLPTDATLYVPAGTKAKYKATDGWKEFTKIIEVGGEDNSNIIQFADANAKAICVQKWDTNGDGELSEMEAAAVTDLGLVFLGNKTITSFNELQYFTGLTSIGEMTFFDCCSLNSITIPNSVTSIGVEAFYGCSGLTSITIPNSVTSIGYAAFYGCSGLTSITIGNSVTSIDVEAFYGCSGLTSVTIPKSVTSIGDAAFHGCTGLTSVTIPSSVMSIGNEAFSGCSGLTSIVVESENPVYDSRGNCNALIHTSTNELVLGCRNTVIPNSVTSIGGRAFGYCSTLTSITIPNSVTSIGSFAFQKCSGLTSVIIPNSVTSIGQMAFQSCTGLTSIIIGNSVSNIGICAFQFCSGLTSIVVESGNTIYDSRDNCNAIIQTETNELIAGCKNTLIPNSVTSIGDFSFENCSGLTSVTIPNSVTSIGKRAFDFCSSLTSVTIPNSVTSIGIMAFYGCSGLTEVYSLIKEPFSINSNVFNQLPADATLYVPASTKAKYEATDGWKEFTKIVEIGSDSERLAANDVTLPTGQTAMTNICLNNGTTTDYTAYQFDLVLPAGIDIAKNAKGKPDVKKGSRYEDDSHTLTVQKVEGTTGTYRVVCFSLENSLIEGTEGALLTVKLQAAAGLNEGEYTAKLENILLTQKDGTQRKLNDATLKIVVSRVVQGDANGDNEVNVADIVEVVNCILGNPSPSFVFAAADLNGDGEVNVTDIVMMVNIIMSGGNARDTEPVAMTRGDGDKLTLNNEGDDAFGLNLHNEAQYVAAQMDIVLTEGQTLADVTLNRDRCESHQLSFQQKGENTYRVLVFSLTNDGFEGSDGNLLSFRIAGGAGSFSVENIVLVQADASQHPFAPLYGETTGIDATLNDNGQMINDKWYDLNGRKLDGQPTRKGVYIRNGKKQTVR